MRQLADDLWVEDRPLRFFGVGVGTRMTVIRLPDGLWLHSPVEATPELERELADLGTVRWAVAPCAFHHLYAGPWIDRGAEGWCARPLARKRADLNWTGVLDGPSPWAELDMVATRSFRLNQECVFLHRATRTLVMSDLLFNFGKDTPLFTRVCLFAAGAGHGPQITLLERLLMHRDEARAELTEILGWDFDRLILAHGDVIETGGKEALRGAYGWILD